MPVKVVAPLLPVALPLRDLANTDTRRQLSREFLKSEARRIDLFCHDTTRAFERLQAVCKGRGVKLLIEPVAQEAIKRKWKPMYVLYSDSLTAAGWTDLLSRLGQADRRAEERRSGDGLFDQAVLLPLEATDRKDLVTLIGTDPLPAPARGHEGAPTGQGGHSESAPSATEKLALVMTYSLRPAQNSKEVKQFLDSRRERVPGTVAVMLVLRPQNP